jgi:[acyl-carrier-protein] S-malonyltransferase
MLKTGFVFPGQGSQKTAMLADMADSWPAIEQTFSEASIVLGTDLWNITCNNPEGLLDQTQWTQPALLAASVALWRVWTQEHGPIPDMLAGHSLGEYSALVCAGVMSFATAIMLVHKRGKYMQEAVPSGIGSMAAIIGMDDSLINGVCQLVAGQEVVAAANFNSPGQTVIAGDRAAVERAMAALKEAGAKRTLPLNVSVPSHCALMKPAADRLAEDLAIITLKNPEIPVVQNINGRSAKDLGEIRENLLKQLYMPVQWVDSIHCMRDFGIGKVVECGPGKVLGGLIKRIHPDMVCFSSDSAESLAAAFAGIKN